MTEIFMDGRLLYSLLRAVGGGILLGWFVRGNTFWGWLRQNWGAMLGYWAVFALLIWRESNGTMWSYLSYLALIVWYTVGAWKLNGKQPAAAVCLALCFFLITDCSNTVLRFSNMRLLGRDPLHSGTPWEICGMSVLLLMAQTVLLALVRRICPPGRMGVLRSASLTLLVISTVPYLFVSQITVWLPLTNEDLTTAVPVMLVGCCGLALLFLLSFVRYVGAEEDKRQMLQLRFAAEQQQQQYLLRKTAVDSVRGKYHDLKNILLYLEQSSDQEAVRAHIKQILNEIQPYEQMTATGNETVDILLGEKLARCQEQKISCTITMNGKLLDFIEPIDLCVIFGNAMDNAIEACAALQDPDARALSVRCQKRGEFVILNFRNSCAAKPLPVDTLPQTTKPDAENHGFGLTNIRMAAEKYGGQMSVRAEQNEFVLTLLFQQKKEEQAAEA